MSRNHPFGWDYPPMVTPRHIDEAADGIAVAEGPQEEDLGDREALLGDDDYEPIDETRECAILRAVVNDREMPLADRCRLLLALDHGQLLAALNDLYWTHDGEAGARFFAEVLQEVATCRTTPS